MPKNQLSMLRDQVRAEISSHISEGSAKARNIARDVCARQPELVGALGSRLAEDAVARMVNQEVKRWGAMGACEPELTGMGDCAFLLDGLPAIAFVPYPNRVYRPLFGAKGMTVRELRIAAKALWKGIEDDRRNAGALGLLLAYLEECGTNDDTRLSEALQGPVGEA